MLGKISKDAKPKNAQREKLSSGLAEKLPIIIFLMAPNARIAYVNSAVKKITGYEPDKIIGRNWKEVFCRMPINDSVKQMFEIIKERDVSNFECEIACKDGKKVFLSVDSTNKYDSYGKLKKIILIGTDITYRKTADAKLWKSEELYRVLIENQGEGFTIVDAEEKFVYSNPAAEKIFGVGTRGLLGKSLEEFVSKEQFRIIRDETQKRRQGQRGNYEVEIARPSGEHRFILVTTTPWLSERGDFEGAAGVFRDITEKKTAQTALENSEAKYRTIIESLGDAVHVTDRNMNLVFFNNIFREWNRELGLSGEPIGKNVFEVFPFLSEKVRKEYEEVLNTAKVLVTHETTQVGGNKIYTETRKIPIIIGEEVESILTVVKDISDKRRMEEDLKREITEKGLILETIAEHVIFQNKDHSIRWANRAAAQSVGLRPEELVGKKCHEIWHRRSYVCEDCPVHEAILKEMPCEKEIRSYDGRVWHIKGYPIFDKEGRLEAAVEITMEITELKKAHKPHD